MDKALRTVVVITLAVILLLAGFAGGIVAGRMVGNTSALGYAAGPSSDKLTRQLDEVRSILDEEALKPPSETSSTIGAITGLLEASGDKYANYFDPKHYEYFNEQTMGAFGGIGVQLGENKSGQAYVVEVYPDTPASRAGIKAGDVFYAIDGVQRDKWETDEVVKRVRGEEGTKVKVQMLRKKERSPLTFSLTRAMIEYPNVESKKYGDVGYVRLGQFNAKSAEEIKREIESLEKKGAKGYVLDLRDNPGGLLNSSVDVVSLFVDDGVVVSVEERGKDPIEYRATGGQITDKPLVVLLNENSASASEITGGALQDYDRAKLVGVKSFGKGSVQTVKELSDGGAIKFTTAHYFTPKHRGIDGKGLQPDVKVEMNPEKQASFKTDLQLQKAIEIIGDQL